MAGETAGVEGGRAARKSICGILPSEDDPAMNAPGYASVQPGAMLLEEEQSVGSALTRKMVKMYRLTDVAEVLRTAGRLLVFQPVAPDLRRIGPFYLVIGLLLAWLAGIGRDWNNPQASLLQHLGLGSVVYVVLLAFFLWALLQPLRPRNWTYVTVLVFVALTSPPAFLYAIPVERFLSAEAAQQARSLFLILVSAWRMALLVFFLHGAAGFRRYELVVATLFLPTLIVSFLSLSDQLLSVITIMGRHRPFWGNNLVLETVTAVSSTLFLVLLASYIFFCLKPDKKRVTSQRQAT